MAFLLLLFAKAISWSNSSPLPSSLSPYMEAHYPRVINPCLEKKKIGARGIERCGGIFLALGRKRYANFAGRRYARFQLTSKYSPDKKKLAITGFRSMAISYPPLLLSRFARKNIFRPCQKDSSFFPPSSFYIVSFPIWLSAGRNEDSSHLLLKYSADILSFSLSKKRFNHSRTEGHFLGDSNSPPSFFWRALFSWFFFWQMCQIAGFWSIRQGIVIAHVSPRVKKNLITAALLFP